MLKQTFAGSVQHGAVEVGTDTVALPTDRCKQFHGVVIKASSANSGLVYVGSQAVTADTVETSSGFPLDPGESLFIAAEEISKIHLVADAAGQFIHWLAR